MVIMKTIQIVKKKTMEQEQDERKDKGVIIMKAGKVMRVDGLHDVFIVRSENNDNILYTVENDTCTCPDFQRRQYYCKHMYATKYYIALCEESV